MAVKQENICQREVQILPLLLTKLILENGSLYLQAITFHNIETQLTQTAAGSSRFPQLPPGPPYCQVHGNLPLYNLQHGGEGSVVFLLSITHFQEKTRLHMPGYPSQTYPLVQFRQRKARSVMLVNLPTHRRKTEGITSKQYTLQ